MNNDIEWKRNDENCISNAEKFKNCSNRFLPGRCWTFLGWSSEKRWYGSSSDGPCDRTANKMVQQWKETSHPIFIATSALSCGSLKRRNGKSTIHFNGDFMNTELLFQTIKSVNQVSIYAAATNWCYNFALKKEENNTFLHPWTIELWLLWKPKKWICWYILNLAQGNLMMQSELKFRVLEKKVRSLIPISCHSRKSLPISARWRRRIGTNHTFMQRI